MREDGQSFEHDLKNRPLGARSTVSAVLLLTGVFFVNFLSRIILAPLMPVVENDLRLNHSDAGVLFLLISAGYLIGLLSSGFLSSRLTHRLTIVLSSLGVGGALLLASVVHSVGTMKIGLLLMGVAAGTYLPSGIATVTSLVHPKNWGKVFAVHEFAPSLSFIMAPFLVQILIARVSWSTIIGIVGCGGIIMGGAFMCLGQGGNFRGEALSKRNVTLLIRNRSFWIMMTLFGFGIGGTLGIYAMLPLYLVSERGLSHETTNMLIGCSRIAVLGASFAAGWISDRFGAPRTLSGVFVASGIVTILLGLVRGMWVIPVLFVQPLVAVCFFPPAFSALSRIGSPQIRGVSVSLTVPFGFLVGGGVIPAALGLMGEYVSFSRGLVLFGGLLLGVIFLAQKLELHEDGSRD